MLAIVRPDAWNLPLLVHVGGAMLLVGAVVLTLVVTGVALRRGADAATLTRLGLRTLLLGVLPSYVIMRAGAEWIASKEDVAGDPAWVSFGYSIGDGGLVLIIVAIVLAWRATRRREEQGPGVLGRIVVALCAVLLIAYAVAIWAMTTKPS